MAVLPPPSDDTSASGPTDETRTSEPRSGRRKRGAVSDRARLGGANGREKRSAKALSVSIGLHAIAAVVLVQLLTFGHGLSGFLGLDKEKDAREERITFVSPRQPKPPEVAPKSKPAVEQPTTDQPRLRPPTTGPVLGTPADAPSAEPAPTRADTGSGLAAGAEPVGALDPNLRGVKPGYNDVRVWRGAGGGGAGAAPGRNGAERLDSIIGYAIGAAADSLDSLARAQGRTGRKPGDWTKTGPDGQKWGWDGTGIRLGKVTIPNALLGLLPLNAQRGMSGNFTEIQRDKRLALAREDIMRNADRALGEAEFRKLVGELRDRRERERRDRLRAPDASIAPAKPNGRND